MGRPSCEHSLDQQMTLYSSSSGNEGDRAHAYTHTRTHTHMPQRRPGNTRGRPRPRTLAARGRKKSARDRSIPHSRDTEDKRCLHRVRASPHSTGSRCGRAIPTATESTPKRAQGRLACIHTFCSKLGRHATRSCAGACAWLTRLEERCILDHVRDDEEADLAAAQVDAGELGGAAIACRVGDVVEGAVHVVLGGDHAPAIELAGLHLDGHCVAHSFVQCLERDADRHGGGGRNTRTTHECSQQTIQK
jgi:hypothetical protein